MKIKDIPKSSADLDKSSLAECKPNWNVEITIEDYNLYKLGFVEEIPLDMTDDEKKIYKKLQELEKRYNKFQLLENLFSSYLSINEKEN